MNIKLNEACQEQHQDVLKKGFEHQAIATNLMLIVSELGEALEAHRKNKSANLIMFELEMPTVYRDKDYNICRVEPDIPITQVNAFFKVSFERHIKDTFEDEIADAFLRLMDLCGEYDIDIEKHIQLKAEYNKLRPYKHGKLY